MPNSIPVCKAIGIILSKGRKLGYPGGSVVKNLPANARDTGVIPDPGRSPREGNDNPLQNSCWKSLWTEEPGMQQSMWLQRVRHDLVTE